MSKKIDFLFVIVFLWGGFSMAKTTQKNITQSGNAAVAFVEKINNFKVLSIRDDFISDAKSESKVYVDGVLSTQSEDWALYMELLGGEMNDGDMKRIPSIEKFLEDFKKLRTSKRKAKLDKERGPMPESVGTATMKEDGTLHMQFRSMDHGMIAEALKIVKPSDPDYEKMVKHLGSIKPGQAKSIPPFEDD